MAKSYDAGKRPVGENDQQPIYQPPADGFVHRPALDAQNLIGAGTYRIGERNMIPTSPRKQPATNALGALFGKE